jgi:hypothetical protein
MGRPLTDHEFANIEAALDLALRKPMGKAQEIAARLSKMKADHAAKLDGLAAKMDGIDQKAPVAFAHAHDLLDQQSADIDAMESELTLLSNQ